MRPVCVGLGQVGLYIGLLDSLTFYIRRFIGYRVWRLLHYLSFLFYLLVLFHGFFSGTDSSAPWAIALYLGSVVSLFPPAFLDDIIALAVRWYVRSRLRYADVIEWFTERDFVLCSPRVRESAAPCTLLPMLPNVFTTAWRGAKRRKRSHLALARCQPRLCPHGVRRSRVRLPSRVPTHWGPS